MNSKRNYLAHTGVKGQKHGVRNYQSYETAPTRSGMVGEERGEAAKQRERLEKLRNKLYKENSRDYDVAIRVRESIGGDKNKQLAKYWKANKAKIDADIANMTLSDLETERKARVGERQLMTMLGLSGGPVGLAIGVGTTAVDRMRRRHNRIGEKVNTFGSLPKKKIKNNQN